YSLLPIIRNTHAGLTGIPPSLRESAEALGLPPLAALWRGGTAAAGPGGPAGGGGGRGGDALGRAGGGAVCARACCRRRVAGGYGRPILRGIDKFDVPLMLEGAVPAALLALAIEGLFGLLERVVPRHG